MKEVIIGKEGTQKFAINAPRVSRQHAKEGTEKVKSTFRLKVNGGEIVVLPFFFCLT